MRALLRRLSLRSRLVLLFTIGSSLVVLAAGLFLYTAIDRSLLRAVDEGLNARANDLEALLRTPDLILFPDQDPFAQVLRADGTVIAASPPKADTPVLSAEDMAEAINGPAIEREIPVFDDEARLFVRDAGTAEEPLTLIVGSPLDQYRFTQQRLEWALLIGGPLLVASVAAAGWLLAGAALRPVERMAEEADDISIVDLSRRLEVPLADDEVAHLARTLNRMLDRVEQAIGHERRFIDDASHELRTPLTILRGELELALVQAEDPEEVLAAVRSSLDEVRRLSRLADDLLVLARARASELQVRSVPVELTAAARKVCELLGDPEGTRLRVTGDEVSINADPDRIDQILLNLVVNAQRFAVDAVEVRVARMVDPELGAPGVELVVADDGDGFAPELLPVAFERFRRDDPTRARGTGGTGLGLAIAAELVRAHGGSIDAGNGDPLGGAWVRVWLPRRERTETQPPPARPRPSGTDRAPATPRVSESDRTARQG